MRNPSAESSPGVQATCTSTPSLACASKSCGADGGSTGAVALTIAKVVSSLVAESESSVAEAVTATVPLESVGLRRPSLVMLPGPLATLQSKDEGCAGIGLPNWSSAIACNWY